MGIAVAGGARPSNAHPGVHRDGTLPQRIDYRVRPSVPYTRDMPVTARLSRDFYDRFGEKVVDELVGLLNDMDATFRAELRELNERNFQRFEAKLEERVGGLDAALRTEMANLRAELRTEIANVKADLIKWMFLFWLGTVATMLGFGRLLLGV